LTHLRLYLVCLKKKLVVYTKPKIDIISNVNLCKVITKTVHKYSSQRKVN